MKRTQGASVFRTEAGVVVPALTADEMREVDRSAVEEFGLSLLQMMENAGRDLAESVLAMLAAAGKVRWWSWPDQVGTAEGAFAALGICTTAGSASP